jgi:hypothetical protein
MMILGLSLIFTLKSYTNDETLQKIIYKHIVDLENVEKGIRKMIREKLQNAK